MLCKIKMYVLKNPYERLYTPAAEFKQLNKSNKKSTTKNVSRHKKMGYYNSPRRDKHPIQVRGGTKKKSGRKNFGLTKNFIKWRNAQKYPTTWKKYGAREAKRTGYAAVEGFFLKDIKYVPALFNAMSYL